MEILIIGVVIVGLMVWASTRIKKNAAAAFESEVIDADTFTLKKPAGWLSIIDPKGYLFSAYTKDYAAEPNENQRRGTATLTISDGRIDAVLKNVSHDAKIGEDIREIIGDTHYRIVELRANDSERRWLKLAASNGSVYTFEVKAVGETTDEFRRDIEAMVDSFEIK